MPDMPAPMLVVEVASNSDTDPKSRERDYTEKRVDYAARQIPEYWIVDPIAAVVLVLTLAGDQYREKMHPELPSSPNPFSRFGRRGAGLKSLSPGRGI
jgi:Uma2 family endonuclease